MDIRQMSHAVALSKCSEYFVVGDSLCRKCQLLLVLALR